MANTTFKILPASWTLNTVEKVFRSFNAKNLGSVGERAAKLLAENDSTPGQLEPEPDAIAHNLGGMAEVADFGS